MKRNPLVAVIIAWLLTALVVLFAQSIASKSQATSADEIRQRQYTERSIRAEERQAEALEMIAKLLQKK